MAKDNKKKNQQEPGSQNIAKYVLFGVILIIAGYFIYTTFIAKEEALIPTVVDPRERIKNVKEPQFKKEGELEFIIRNKSDSLLKIDIEIAEDDTEREQGLMYRRSMDDTKGMLFIFESEKPQSFWMKNTIIPLDIIYVNSKRDIVKIYKNTTPFSEISLPSDKPAVYVVEVAGGYTDRYGIKEGDRIRYSRE